MKLPPAAAISLDVDGTLYRVRRMRVAWRLRRERGLLVALVAAREKIRREAQLADRAALEAREVELVAPSFDLRPEEAAERLARIKEALPEALCRGMRPRSGVRAALEAAHARGLRLAVLSDFDPRPKLGFLGLADLPWSVQIGCEDHGALKPQTRPFEVLKQSLDLPGERIVHIGDREGLDVRGALQAGVRAWLYADEPKASSEAERVFTRWNLDLFAPLWGDGPT